MSNSKSLMLQLIKQIFVIFPKNLKLAPKKSFFMLPTVNYFGLEKGLNTIKSFQSLKTAIHKNPRRTTKTELLF